MSSLILPAAAFRNKSRRLSALREAAAEEAAAAKLAAEAVDKANNPWHAEDRRFSGELRLDKQRQSLYEPQPCREEFTALRDTRDYGSSQPGVKYPQYVCRMLGDVAQAKLLSVILGFFANHDGICFAKTLACDKFRGWTTSYPRLGRLTHMTADRCRRLVQRLQRDGWIAVDDINPRKIVIVVDAQPILKWLVADEGELAVHAQRDLKYGVNKPTLSKVDELEYEFDGYDDSFMAVRRIMQVAERQSNAKYRGLCADRRRRREAARPR